MPRIKAILFDMDGVLIDAREWHYDALNMALGHFGFEISRYEHLKTYDGLSTMKKLEVLSVEKGLPRALHSFINQMKQDFTFDLVMAKCRPNFRHRYLLSKLHERGTRLAVCSNSIARSVELMLSKASIRDRFELVLSSEDVERVKPDPQIYHLAMERLELTPAECLIVEDNQHGIAAARASGAHLLIVRSPADVHVDTLFQKLDSIEVPE